MKIQRTEAVKEYYAKHKSRIDKVFGNIGNKNISPELKFSSWAYASVQARFGTKSSAFEELGLLVDKAQYGQDYADSKAVLLALKKQNKNIDLRKSKYRVDKFSDWVKVEDDTYAINTDTGDWNGGTQYIEYLSSYSVNKEANIVLYYGYGSTIGDDSESPFETKGTMTVDDLEGILGYAI